MVVSTKRIVSMQSPPVPFDHRDWRRQIQSSGVERRRGPFKLTAPLSLGNMRVLGRRVLKGDRMGKLKSEVVPKNSGAAFEIKKGQRLRIAGKSIVDFVAFNLRDLTERFDQARTKTNQVKIFISTGDILYSKRNNPMLTIVGDTFTEGRHDLQKGMCSRKRFEMVAQASRSAYLPKASISTRKKPRRFPITVVGRI